MELLDFKCTFVNTEKVEQSHVGTHLKPIEFLAYPEDQKLCVIKHFQEYIKQTQVLRNNCSQLLLCHVKPHGPASKDTISRWSKNVPKSAGIDVSKFTAHSSHSESASFLGREECQHQRYYDASRLV